jgi:hypothetical protein
MTSSVPVRALAGDEGLVLGWSRDSNHVTTQVKKQTDSTLGGGTGMGILGGAKDRLIIGPLTTPHGMRPPVNVHVRSAPERCAVVRV